MQKQKVACMTAAGFLGIEFGSCANPPIRRQGDLGADVALEMPASAIGAKILHGRSDARGIDRLAEP